MKRLVVNADDLGISRGTNRAIEDGVRRGIVTSASLLVNLPAFEDAVRLSRDHPELAVGLHLCLTTGRAVLPAGQVSLLADAQGRFRHSFAGLWRLLRSPQRSAAVAQIAAEADAQWERARQAGVVLGHLDSHQHVHMLPEIFSIAAGLAHRHQVPLRVSFEPWQTRSLAIGPDRIRRGLTGIVKAELLAVYTRRVAGLGRELRRSDRCYGIVHSGRMTREVVGHLLALVPSGVTELITHPSLETGRSSPADLSTADRQFLLSPWRQAEHAALVDAEIRDRLAELDIHLLRGIANLRPAPSAAVA